LEVQFNGSGSDDLETAAEDLIYQWDFGDGSSANDLAVPGVLITTGHVYTTLNGAACTADNICVFNPTLTVTDTGGISHTATKKIVVGNTRPKCVIAASPTQGPSDLEVSFDASASIDDDGDILTVCFDFDDPDSEKPKDRVTIGDAEDGTITHIYQVTGNDAVNFQPIVKISDRPVASCDDPSIDFVECEVGRITVTANRKPTAAFDVVPARGVVGLPLRFDASKSADPDGTILTYVWDFGDGSAPVGGQQSKQVSHTYDLPNISGYTVTLTVTDDSDATDVATKLVSVDLEGDNRAPIAHIATGPRIVEAGSALRFDGRNSFDPNGDDLLFTWTSTSGKENIRPGVNAEVVDITFDNAGKHTVTLTVNDRRSLVDDEAVEIQVTEANGQPPSDDGTGQDRDVPLDSAAQRPTTGLCGLGMIMSLTASLLGMVAMMVSRRRTRPQR
jgi:PKD repeat protein